MTRTLSLLTCLALLPAIANAGDGPVVSLTGSGIAPVEASDPLTNVATVVDAGSDVQYCWSAVAGTSASAVASYRYGWDVADPNDPNDPGWAVADTPFDGTETCSPVEVYFEGSHSFVVLVEDEAAVVTGIEVQIQINQAVPTAAASMTTIKGRY